MTYSWGPLSITRKEIIGFGILFCVLCVGVIIAAAVTGPTQPETETEPLPSLEVAIAATPAPTPAPSPTIRPNLTPIHHGWTQISDIYWEYAQHGWTKDTRWVGNAIMVGYEADNPNDACIVYHMLTSWWIAEGRNENGIGSNADGKWVLESADLLKGHIADEWGAECVSFDDTGGRLPQ